MAENADIQDKLALLKKSYLNQLPEKLVEIERAAVGAEYPDRASIETVKGLAHKLVGSGATFGYPVISDAARIIENKCSAILQEQDSPGDPGINFAKTLIEGMKEAVEIALSGGSAPPQAGQTEPSIEISPESKSQTTRIVILVGCNDERVARLSPELTSFDFKVLAVDGAAELADVEFVPAPAGIVYDLDFIDGATESNPSPLTAIRAVLDKKGISCPLVVVSENGDVPHRLRALRAKATSFLVKPVLTTDLVDTLDVEVLEHGGENYRILVVDDDESTASFTKIILNGAGMIVETENDPMNILHRMDDFSPELILMDLYMPGCNGHELASVIRQQEIYSGIPIVFLSGEDDVDKQLGAMEYGGDDFLTKPIRPAHLISSVRVRSARFRKLRSRMIRDSMTGLLNHTTTQEFLNNEINRAQREKTTLAVASLDIDHFKNVNDTYGHAVGDIVIKSLSRLLRQRLRSIDIIGRMGGEEFAAVLVGASIEKAAEILEEIRQTFASIVQIGDGKEFSVTLSCGIADFPTFKTQAELLEASDKALYEAKHGGRNKVVIATSYTKEH